MLGDPDIEAILAGRGGPAPRELEEDDDKDQEDAHRLEL